MVKLRRRFRICFRFVKILRFRRRQSQTPSRILPKVSNFESMSPVIYEIRIVPPALQANIQPNSLYHWGKIGDRSSSKGGERPNYELENLRIVQDDVVFPWLLVGPVRLNQIVRGDNTRLCRRVKNLIRTSDHQTHGRNQLLFHVTAIDFVSFLGPVD